jgi:phosphate transport system substrate-binding protein
MHRFAMCRRLATIGISLCPIVSLMAGSAVPRAQARTAFTAITYLNGAGSTFIAPLMTTWASTYRARVDPAVRIRYQSVGSSGGIQLYDTSAIDFAASEAFLTDAQIQAAGGDVLHLPLTLGPVALIYNLPTLTRPLRLDGPTLARIFLGKITRWSDPALAALNPGATLPVQRITTTYRADGSGTSFIFTNYLSAVSPIWRSTIGSGTMVNWPTGLPGRGSGGIARAVQHTIGSIGYVALSYVVANHLVAALLKNKDGVYVAPTVAGAAADAANAGRLPPDLRATIVDAPGAHSYPLSGFTWAVLHEKAPNRVTYAALLKFLWWCIHDGQKLSTAGTLRYAPLPAYVVRLDEAKIRSVTYNGRALL